MGRPKNISTNIDTSYFSGVSPIWTKPHIITDCQAYRQIKAHLPYSLSLETPEERDTAKRSIENAIKLAGLSIDTISKIWIEKIDDRYHTAAEELAKWDPSELFLTDRWEKDSWVKHPESIFFKLRTILIDHCEKYKAFDWEENLALYTKRKESVESRKTLKGHVDKLISSLKKTKVDALSHKLSLSIIQELTEGSVKIKNGINGHEETINALNNFKEQIANAQLRSFKFGCIEYGSLPSKICSKEIAIGLLLADTISCRQRNGFNVPINYPKVPNINIVNGLPWLAITEFLQTIDESKLLINNNVRTNIINLKNKVNYLHN